MRLLHLFSRFFIVWAFFIANISIAQTAPPSNLNGQNLRIWLKQNYFDGSHSQLGYDTARMYMYNYIDNKNNSITGVYSGLEIAWNYGGTGTNPQPLNCEHVVPQSLFGYQEPMKSDIHHLFPTYGNWNSTRSSHPFAEIDDSDTTKWMYLNQSQASKPTSNIDAYSEYANSTFEPREDHKGNTARAIFYFYTMYPTQGGNISSLGDINTLYQWHLDDPVDSEELARNNATETYQGNRNPYIDYPSLVASAWGFSTTPSAPTAVSMQLQATTNSIDLSWNSALNEDGYRLYKSSNGGAFVLLSTLGASATAYTDNAVVANNSYAYYIVAFNAVGNSPNSNIANGQLDSGNNNGGNASISDLIISEYVEGASYNKAIEIANFTGQTVDLSDYSLFKQTNGAGSWNSELALSGSLANGAVYVIANNKASSAILAIADINTSAAALSFNGNDAVALFKNNNAIDVVGIVNSSANFGKDVTLVRKEDISSPTTNYDSDDWISFGSNTISDLGAHTVVNTADTEAPSSPTGLNSTNIGENSFTVTWNTATDNVGVITYQVYLDNSLFQTTAATQSSITGLSLGNSYQITVSATDAAGNTSNISSALNVTTVDVTAPSTPQNINVQNIGTTDFELVWDAATDNVGVVGYTIYTDGIYVGNSSNPSFTFSSLDANTTYVLTILAEDAAGNSSGLSTALQVTTLEAQTGGDGSLSELLISEYVEGSSYNKAIEIANFTGQTVDLSSYTLYKQTNGSGSWSSALNLSGSLANGAVYVIAHGNANATISAAADLSSNASVLSFNGNDAIALFKNGSLLDVVGVYNSTANFGKDTTLVRKSDITGPSTTFDPNDWDVLATNDSSNLGNHTVTGNTSLSDVVLVNSDFENGYGDWVDGGADCKLYGGGTYANSGLGAINLQDNTSTSKVTLKDDLDLSNAVMLAIEFHYSPVSFENTERFYVEFYTGSQWQIIGSYVHNTDFSNNNNYVEAVTIDANQYNFTTNNSIRFRCDASGNADDVYIDDVVLTATVIGTAQKSSKKGFTAIEVESTFEYEETNSVYPVPSAVPVTCTITANSTIGQVQLALYNSYGQLLKMETFKENSQKFSHIIEKQIPGNYFLLIQTAKASYQKQLIFN